MLLQVAAMAPVTSILFALLISTAATLTSLTDAASSSPPWLAIPPPPCLAPPSAVEFLRARCATTPYGVTCYDALIPYACTFQTSHVKLARAAADVNLAWLRGLSMRFKEVGAGVEAAALRDCASTVASAASLAKKSAAELANLDAAGAAGRNKVRWSVINVQTWLSASIANEVMCADGIGVAGAAASLAARELVIGVLSAKEHTTIALALVNGIPVPS